MLYLIATRFSKRAIFGLLFSVLYLFANSQCNFNEEIISPKVGLCQPALFKVVATNVPTGSKLLWDVGKGYQNGFDTFYAYIQNPGKISINVQIKYANGKICNISKINFLEVFSKPEPEFYISRKKLCYGADTVTYFDNTKNSSKRSWVIDGTNYYNAKAKQKHQFSTTGSKKIAMIVEDNNGCKAIKEFDSTVTIYKDMQIDFVADNTSGCVSKKVAVVPNINNNGNKIVSYKWLSPGAEPSMQTIENPDTFIYNYSGKYSILFEAVTDKGCIHQKVKYDYLAFGHIDSMSIKYSDSTVCKGRFITIENIDKTLPGKFSWFANDAVVVLTPDNYSCKAKYDKIGIFNLTIVYNYNGCKLSKTINNYVRVKGVEAKFSSVDNYHCKFPHLVHFKNTSKAYEPGRMTYQWQYFNDNKLIRISSITNDTFNIKQQGEYDVVLITRHANGCVDTFKQNKYIRNNPIMPLFDADVRVGCIGQTIEFLQNTPKSSYKSPDNFTWTFYDKNKSKILGYSNESSPEFSYNDTGFYSVKMIADNGIGCKDSIEIENLIEIVIPKINYKIESPIFCKGEKLIAFGNSDPKRANFRYFWYLKNRNDGTEISKETSAFDERINNAGEYDLKFVHQINNGCRDSIINNELIKVNEISAELKIDTFNGCTPLTVKPKAIILNNFHFENPSNIVEYKWSTSYNENAIISDSKAQYPEITFTKTGEYFINLEITNSSGCKQIITSQPIYVGVKAEFTVSDYIVCPNQLIQLKDKSYLLPTSIKWVLTKDAVTGDNLSQNEINIKYNIDNRNKVGIIASKFDKCYDTAFSFIKSIIVKSDFKAIDTILKCSPVYAQFISKSKNADSLVWEFGNAVSFTTTDSFVANIYRKNTGIKNGYKVSLIAKSNEGCNDTLTKGDYLHVVGPTPKFEMINNVGCEPLSVIFIDNSDDAFTHYINYDDGTKLNSDIGTHIYTIQNKQNLIEEHIPVLFAVDSLGCKAEYVSDIPIVVKQTSKSTFSVSDTVVCQNEDISYIDNSQSITKSEFYLYGSSKIRLNEKLFKIEEKGNFELVQIVENTNLCTDSMKVKIIVNPNPVADFITYDSICKQKLVTFYNTTKSGYNLQKFDWELKSYGISSVYNTPVVSHLFNNSGANTVELTVTDINNCSSSIKKYINVPNPDEIPSAELNFVSVNSDNTVNIITMPVVYSRFASASLYNTNLNLAFHNTASKNIEVVTYNKTFAKDSSVCFDYRINDICGYTSNAGKKHCTVFLQITNNKPFVTELNWTPYIGWDKVDKYIVYRKTVDDPNYSKICEVESTIHTYKDSGVCNRIYTYYIEAKHNELVSKSNMQISNPLIIFPQKYTDIRNVSVNEDNSITVKWDASKNINFKNYILNRINVETNKLESYELYTNYYRDYDVNTSSNYYIYSVIETDKCGNKSIADGIGKNIVINASSSSYFTQALWNKYKSWKSGVKGYTLQIKKDGSFKSIYSSSSIDSVYYHNQTLEIIHGAYCYRIMAISNDMLDTSYSNITCIISPSKMFMANAFTPNGDEINDKIGVKTLFIENNTELKGRNFTLRIYNRWGEIVFETNNIDEEWDGKYRGVKAQSGVYIYKIKAMGADNHSYSIEGNINLL